MSKIGRTKMDCIRVIYIKDPFIMLINDTCFVTVCGHDFTHQDCCSVA